MPVLSNNIYLASQFVGMGERDEMNTTIVIICMSPLIILTTGLVIVCIINAWRVE